MCDRCETVCVSLPVWLCMRLYDCGNTPEHPGSSFPSPPHPPQPAKQSADSDPVSMSAWKPLRKTNSGKDCWVSVSHSLALSGLGCRSTSVICPV